jgi:3'-5' exoribonuclease
MKGQYVRDLVEGAKVDSVFALRSRDIRLARTGEAYLAVELADRSGSTRGVMFRPSPSDEAVPAGTVVRVRGTVTAYRGVRRISLDSLRPEPHFEHEDLLPSSARERSELIGELRAMVRGVSDPPLRRLLNRVFGAPGFVDRFASCPGSAGRHHAVIGGLLEHSLSVASACLALAPSHPLIDRDLLVAAALLHDVGTVEELDYDTAVGCTEAGRLIGHVVLGERLVAAAAIRLGDLIPHDRAQRLSHAILAHHGGTDGGASCPPCTIEALVLQAADSLDIRLAQFTEATAGAAVLEERWTDSSNPFGTPLLVPASRRPEAAAPGSLRCA